MRRLSSFFALGLLPAAVFAQAQVEVERNGDIIRVEAAMPVAVEPNLAWGVLTDYDHLADFVPDMRSCRIVSAMPLQVEQKGETGFLVWHFPVEVVLEIEERPPKLITFKRVPGSMKNMQEEWRIKGAGEKTQLEYSATMQLDFWVPSIIGTAVIRHDVGEKVEGVARAMLRRKEKH